MCTLACIADETKPRYRLYRGLVSSAMEAMCTLASLKSTPVGLNNDRVLNNGNGVGLFQWFCFVVSQLFLTHPCDPLIWTFLSAFSKASVILQSGKTGMSKVVEQVLQS